MKKLLLTFGTFVLLSFGMNATTNTNTYYNNNGKSFTFVENGVTYSVFQNGEFDFYINQRNGLNVNYNTNNVNISFNSGYNYDAFVQYDSFGAVIQIENTPIFYDYYGRVTRVGNININYYNGRLVRLGGLRVYYNNYGSYAYYRGFINAYNRHYVYHPYHNYFARPYYDYRVVSYKPYRNHFKPHRYTYHKDHSKNKYYSKRNTYNHKHKGGKYDSRKKQQSKYRVATNNVPKRSNEYYKNNSKHQVAREMFKNDKGNYERSRTNTNRKSVSYNQNRKENSSNKQRGNTSRKQVSEKKVTSRDLNSNSRTYQATSRNSSNRNSKSATIDMKRKSTVTARKSVEKNKSSEENMRKRRSI